MDDQQFTFLMEEYKSLKTEVGSLVKEARFLETAAVAGTAAVYAWLAKTPDADIASVGWWIPIFFPIFGATRYVALIRRIMHIAQYIRAIEGQCCQAAPGGWETFLAGKRKTMPGLAISISSWILWVTLLAITITVGICFGG